ncbi:MAG: Gfo/Idh/MocA family oxidoreductase [Candidatus Hydrogenedentes bacterium]|nr:Gfo/Idh/MocA family oxidoreductase [Candidatus Hydrogenedentota bacterium]
MKTSFSRRDFLKTAGTAAGVAIAAGYSPFSYAQNDKVRVAAIGTGGQGSLHLRYGLTGAKDIELVAVCDVYKPHLDGGWEQAVGKDETKRKNVKKYMDYREMLDKEKIDAVVISTPLYTHHPITMDCLSAGKYVFCEKTLAYTVEECREVVKKCNDTGLWVQVGHQRRYNPGYNRAMALAAYRPKDSKDKPNTIGRINYITAQWHRNNDWRRPVDKNYVLSDEEKKFIKVPLDEWINWRLYHKFSAGGLMTELACHQLDVTNWFLNTPPKRVMGFGGVDYWKDGRDVDDNVLLAYEYEVRPSNPAFYAMDKRSAFQDLRKINQPYTVRVEYSSICSNAKRGAGEQLHGDIGTLELTEPACFKYREPAAAKPFDSGGVVDAKSVANAITSGKSREVSTKAEGENQQIRVPGDTGKDGKPIEMLPHVDVLQFESFVKDIKAKAVPKANQIVGLMAAIAALSGEKAMREGKTIDIDPALYAFDFKTPDPYRFDDPGEVPGTEPKAKPAPAGKKG